MAEENGAVNSECAALRTANQKVGVCVRVCMYVCMYIYVCMHVYVYAYYCMYVCMNLYAHAYIFVIRAYKQAQMQIEHLSNQLTGVEEIVRAEKTEKEDITMTYQVPLYASALGMCCCCGGDDDGGGGGDGFVFCFCRAIPFERPLSCPHTHQHHLTQPSYARSTVALIVCLRYAGCVRGACAARSGEGEGEGSV